MIAKTKSIRAYSYIRLSTAEQAKGYGEGRQADSTTLLAEKNGWTLDDRLKLYDKGSGFKGFQPKLKAFIRAIHDGDVAKGSVLIVEHLDRLTRQNQTEAVPLFLEIVNAGITIATIHPERIFDKKTLNDGFGLIEVVVSLKLANEESEKKAWRAKDNHSQSRQKARQHKRPTARCPSWLRIVDRRVVDGRIDPKHPGRFEVIKEKEKIVKTIFKHAIEDGWGAKRIANHLNQNGIPNIAKGNTGKRDTWNQVYVHGILTRPAVMGIYQPCTEVDGKLVPDGEPIEGYYPVVIDKETFYAAQAANNRRKIAGGNPGKQSTNLFTGMLFDARTKEVMRIKNGVFNSWHVEEGPSWHYRHFETGFLDFLTEVSFSDSKPEGADVSALTAELEETRENLAKIEADILGGAPFDRLKALMGKLSSKENDLERQIEQAKADTVRDATTVEDVAVIGELLAKAKPEARSALRDRLKSKMRLVIDSIWMLIETYQGPEQKTKIATVQVFVGEESRIFLLVKKHGKWFHFPLQGRQRYKFDLRKWDGKPLYKTDAEGGVVGIPLDGFE